MIADILFGTAGPPESAHRDTSVDGLREVARLKLDTMELEFVRGVRMGPETAKDVNNTANALGMPLSVHAPYYINLASTDPDKHKASIKRILDTARVAALCGADQVVFHPGFYQELPPKTVFRTILKNVKYLRKALDKENLTNIILRPEVTGKASQFGDPVELFELCRELPGVLPCIDFSHYYARSLGESRTYEDFSRLLESMGAVLGDAALHNIHAHLSGIEYGRSGETRHVNMAQSGLDHKPVLRALQKFNARGRIICESPDRGKDALTFKRFWKKLSL